MNSKQAVKQKPKSLRCYGHINVSNVNSEKSECVTLTYSIKNTGKLSKAYDLKEELDDMSGETSTVSVEITDFGTDEETIDMKYKIKSCGDEEKARKIKDDLDKFLRKRGGQTTLDESYVEEN